LLYGLAVAGERGAKEVVDMIEKDLIRTQCLCGKAHADNWRPAVVQGQAHQTDPTRS
jgi:isopentenyl diphosphate isomerase/L-lactate dehydrogenase-like FMN-dependent dehydrogenase